ncbi:MAG: M13 family metallopeptidase [Planctomycetota bacterium]
MSISQYLTVAMQGGTTLPDRDFYLEEDERYTEAQEALKQHIDKLFVLANRPAEDAAAAILALETELAKVQWSRTELRDANKRYNKYTLADAQQAFPGIDWQAVLAAASMGQPDELNIITPSFFEGLQPVLENTPLETWKDYLRFKLIDQYAPALSDDFAEAHFDLHQRVLAGVPAQKPRWERGVAVTAGRGAGDFGVAGDLVGRLYVQEHFPPEAKQRMTELVDNLLRAYEQSIGDLAWMTDVTKEKALDKLSKITTKIGYPDKWRSYDGLEIRPDDLVGNLMRSARYEHQRDVQKLGQPVDREEWGMTPQTVNAYYNPGMNEIVFPAAILQPPFFSMEADDAVNYGGIGAVIGHEISHGFDDQGSKYDGDGNLKDWWNAKDRHEFTQLTQRLIDQYSQYEPLPGKMVNGELTLGENIADLSGLAIAHQAYHLSLDGMTPPELDGWSGDQRFFMGWSQVWRRKYRDAEMIRRLLTDPHSPSWYRANGPVVNIDAFYEAFDVQPEDALYRAPEERIKIW